MLSPGRSLKRGGTRWHSQLYSGIIGSVNFKFTEFHVSDSVRPMDQDGGHDSLKSIVSDANPFIVGSTHKVNTFANNILDLPVLPLPFGETLPF